MISLPPNSFTKRPFLVHKTQNFSYTFLSESRNQPIHFDIATKPPTNWAFNPSVDFQNTGSNIYSGPLYAATKQLFYESLSFASGTIINRVMYPSGSSFFYPSGSTFYVLSISSSAFGAGITPGTFAMTAPLSTSSLYDDSNGNILCENPSSGYVGNIFYDSGLIVLQQSTGISTASIVSSKGIYLNTGSQVDVQFDSSRTLYEFQTICTIGAGELNYSVNPSVNSTQYIGSGSILSLFSSGSISPYMTSIGLYDDLGQLLAVGKFPKPILRAINSNQTIVIRFDY